jgi:hypothetical protein
MMKRLVYALAVLLSATSAFAQTTATDVTRQARTHFQAGLTRAQQGDLNAALREFEAAYAIQPHFSVLYNIGQARSTLGQPVEASVAFERYLQDGGEQLPAGRRREVETMLASLRGRIGRLRIVAPPAGSARVWLDGTELSAERLTQPISVATGKHTVLQAGDTGPVHSRVVSVSPSEVTELRLSDVPPPRSSNAQLLVQCEVPGVTVEVAGISKAMTPLAAPLLVPAGPLTVRFSRTGYAARNQSIIAEADGLISVACEQRPLTPLPPTVSARLVVTTTPTDANVTIDGKPWTRASLPAGLHRLTVDRDGYRPVTKLIDIPAGKLTEQHLTLTPTATSREREQLAKAKRKTAGVVLGSLGVAMLASGVSIYAWNSGRYDDWQAQQLDPNERSDGLTASIQRADDISIGLGILGAGLLAGGSWLFFTTD